MKAKTEKQQSHGDTKLDTECDSRGKRVNSHNTSENAGVGRKTSEVVVLDGIWENCVLMVRTTLRTEGSTAETLSGREEVEL